jgi:hypothetical protein
MPLTSTSWALREFGLRLGQQVKNRELLIVEALANRALLLVGHATGAAARLGVSAAPALLTPGVS